MKKKLLITGIAGFIGAKIAKKVIEKGYDVIGVDDLSSGREENIPNRAEFLKLDLSKKDDFKQLPINIDFILHLAGQSSGDISFDNPILDLKKNSVDSIHSISQEIASNIIEKMSGDKLNESSIKATVEDLAKKNIGKYL